MPKIPAIRNQPQVNEKSKAYKDNYDRIFNKKKDGKEEDSQKKVTKKREELTPQQIDFLTYYNDPESETFSNAKQSALKAGYSEEYAKNMTGQLPDWLSDNISRRRRLLNKAESNLETLLDSKDERVKGDMTKFVAKTLGKDVGYSERHEHTGKDGKDLIPDKEAKESSDNAINEFLNDNSGDSTK